MQINANIANGGARANDNIAIPDIENCISGSGNVSRSFWKLPQEDIEIRKEFYEQFDTSTYSSLSAKTQSRVVSPNLYDIINLDHFGWRLSTTSTLGVAHMDPEMQYAMNAASDAFETFQRSSADSHPKGLEKLHVYVRTAILACSFFIATGAAFYESSLLNIRRHAPFGVNKEDLAGNDFMTLEAVQHDGHNVLSLVVFTTATTTIYHVTPRHRFQDHFLLVGFILGAVIGMVIRDMEDMLLRVLPWTILASLMFSIVVHGVQGRIVKNSSLEV